MMITVARAVELIRPYRPSINASTIRRAAERGEVARVYSGGYLLVNDDDCLRLWGETYESRGYVSPGVTAAEPCISYVPPSKMDHRVIYWTDTHVSPGQDLSRIKWIARYIKNVNPDLVVHGGDFSTFDSCSAFDPLGSVGCKEKVYLDQDFEVTEEALRLYHSIVSCRDIRHVFTEGNHENRLKRKEDSQGVLKNTLYPRLANMWTTRGWEYYYYGEFFNYESVNFTHIPHNTMGKPYGSQATLLRDMTHDLVIGHTHKEQKITQPKIGMNNGVTLLNGPCSLPQGHVEKYAKLNTTNWAYGLVDLTIRDGRIQDTSFVSMTTLESRFGSK